MSLQNYNLKKRAMIKKKTNKKKKGKKKKKMKDKWLLAPTWIFTTPSGDVIRPVKIVETCVDNVTRFDEITSSLLFQFTY